MSHPNNALWKNTKVTLMFSVLLTLIAFSNMSYARTEQAPYTVLHQDDNIEVRFYQPMVTAQVSRKAPNDSGSFRKLFNYISGNNAHRQEIAMTAPVFNTYDETGTSTMAFVMPENMTLLETPSPKNKDVQIKSTEPQHFIVIEFSGRMSNSSINAHAKELYEWAVTKGINISGNLVTAGYNSPYTPSSMRRNEVLFPINKFDLEVFLSQNPQK